MKIDQLVTVLIIGWMLTEKKQIKPVCIKCKKPYTFKPAVSPVKKIMTKPKLFLPAPK